MMGKKFLSITLALAMILSMTVLNVSAARELSADGGSVSGAFHRDDDDDRWYETWYPLEITQDGVIELSAIGDPDLTLSVRIYDENKNSEIKYGYGRDQTIKVEAPLAAGSFYVKVSRNGGEGSYTLKSKFTPQVLANDKEDNDSFQYANTINIDGKVTGHLGYYDSEGADRVDWYEINIPVEGLLNLSFLGDPELSAYVYLYRNDGSSYITSEYGKDKVINISEPLTAGNYFIKLEQSNAHGGYTLSNKFQIFGKTNESEPNDSFQKSKEMSDGGVYVGTVGSYSNDDKDKNDWYKIYVPAGMYLRTDLSTEETLGANVRIYNVDGGSQIAYAYTYNGGNAKCYKKIETAGTYYVCVNDPSGYGRYAVMATLSLDEPKYASSLMVPADPTAYQEVTIPTSTTVETTPTVSKNETTNYIILQVDNPLMNANGKPQAIDVGIGTTPVVYNGRTLVPIRAIVEKMGGTVGWEEATSSITLTYKATTIKLVVDSTTATVNGAAKTLDVAPMVLNGRTLLPIRFITENFGGNVEWEDRTSTITLKY